MGSHFFTNAPGHEAMFFLSLVAIVVVLPRGRGTEVFIEARNDLGGGRYKVIETFSYSKPFVKTSANVPSEGVWGYLWVAHSGGRLPLDPPCRNASWIVLVPELSEGRAEEVFLAGCTAMVAPLSANNTHFLRVVTPSSVPTVLIDKTVTIFITAQPRDEALVVYVRTSSTVEVVTFSVCGLGAVCLCASVCLTWWCCRRRGDNPTDDLPRRQPARGLQESIRRHIRQLQAEDPNQSQVPLGPAHTKLLPTSRYKRDGDTYTRCPVCMCDYRNWEKVRTMTCGHFFHVACIDEWLINYSSVCPLCKKVERGCAVESSFSTSVPAPACEETPVLLGGSGGRQTYGGVADVFT